MNPMMPMVAVLAVGAASMAGAADISGQWARGDGNAKVKIAPCGSDVCAVNTWIKPGTPKEKEGDKLVMSIKQTPRVAIRALLSIRSVT